MNTKTVLILVIGFAVLVTLGLTAAGAVFAVSRVVDSYLAPDSRAEVEFSDRGVIVARVDPAGPAAEAGVVRGDILLAVGGKEVSRVPDVGRALESFEAGEEVQLTILHGDEKRVVTVELRRGVERPDLGLALCCGAAEPSGERPPSFAGAGAVILEVIPESPASEAGLMIGDRVLSVEGEAIGPDNDLAQIIREFEPGDRVTLAIGRPGEDEPLRIDVRLAENSDAPGQPFLGVRYTSAPFPQDFDFDFEGEGLPEEGFQFNLPPFGEGFMIPEFEGRGFIFPDLPLDPGVLPNLAGGALVLREILPGGPAGQAGVSPGDMITALDGGPVEGRQEFSDAIPSRRPGEVVTLTIFRPSEGRELQIEVELGENPGLEGAGYLGVSIGAFIQVDGFRSGDLNRPFERDPRRFLERIPELLPEWLPQLRPPATDEA